MDYSQVVNVVEYFLKRFSLEEISLLGGEPTIVPYFIDFVHYLRLRFDKQIIVNTNGLYQEPFNSIPSNYIDNVAVSIDGISENTNDSIRGRGTLQKSIETLRYLIERGFTTSILFTAMGTNILEIIDAIYFFDSLGVSEMNFYVVSNQGNCRSNPELLITASQWLNVIDLMKKTKNTVKMRIKYPQRFISEEDYGNELREGYHCIIRDVEKLHVLPNGRVYCCCLFLDTQFNIYQMSDNLVRTHRSERTFYENNPNSSCVAADKLGICRELNYKTLCIHWKKYI